MPKEIPLSRGKSAIVDDEDFEWLSQWKWSCGSGRFDYAVRADYSTGKRKTVIMHREILSAQAGDLVDHINHDTLDNRRANLRKCTNTENVRHQRPHNRSRPKSSSFKGVSLCRFTGLWAANIVIDRQRLFLGRFAEEAYAAQAYDLAAIKHFGEFALLNFPSEADTLLACETEIMSKRSALRNGEACRRGHPWTEENTRIYKGRKFCRACKRLRERST